MAQVIIDYKEYQELLKKDVTFDLKTAVEHRENIMSMEKEVITYVDEKDLMLMLKQLNLIHPETKRLSVRTI